MIFVLNELSLHGQFNDISAFQQSLKTIMRIRQQLSRFGYPLLLKRGFKDSYVIGRSTTLQHALSSLTHDQRMSVMSWMTTMGPFWSDDTQHFGDDEFFVKGANIVGSALAEASYYCYLDEKASSISFCPSSWNYSPIVVKIGTHDQSVDNFWEEDTVSTHLMSTLPEPCSWEMLESNSRTCFSKIIFLDDAFSYLNREPFSKHVATEISHLLRILNFLKSNFDDNGQPTETWKKIYRDYFATSSPRFSDSSDTEKAKFKSELCFRNPVTKQMDMFCPWHGKIHSPQIRIHFTYPINAKDDLFVAYIGPKITKI